MSVDTKALRDWVRHCGISSWVEKVTAMCDEIDRLHNQIKGLENDAAEWAIRIAEEKNELITLREQLRPRSIKDEPPPKDRAYLAFNGGAWRDRIFEPAPGDKAWLPMPPDPPQPDAFEMWAEAQPWWQDCGDFNRACVRDGWRAAIQSTKRPA